MERATGEQRAWFFYDWANSAFITTVATVLIGPYLTTVAERAACGYVGSAEQPCREHLSVLGLSVSAGSLVFYVITASTLISAFVLPFVGAIADRVASRRRLMGRLAWSGAFCTGLLFFVTGTNWQLGCILLLVSNILYGASLVVYDALLIDVAEPDERDRISSRGWAFGYLGGGLLLAGNLAFVTLLPFGLSTETRRPDQPAVGRRVVGGLDAHPLPGHHRSAAGRARPSRGRSTSAASASCGGRCARCGPIRRPCSCCWPT